MYKQLRYYYWIMQAFTKKNAKHILLSFFLSIITIVSIISLSPYFVNYATQKKEIIGQVGRYNYNNLPDEVLSKISNGLIFINAQGEIMPVLIESWEQVDNGKEYRFHLKKNLYWNDGSKFIAKDIQYTFKDVEKKVINDYTITFKLKKPLPIFPTYLTKPILKNPLVGVAGLYKVERIQAKYGTIQELHFSPNKENLPSYIYKFYEDESRMINAYKVGEINQMTILKKSVADTFTSWKNTKTTKVIDYSRLLTLFFNMDNPLIKENKDVRQAVAYAMNRERYKDLGNEALGPIPPISWAFYQDIKRTPFDPELAKKIFRNSLESTQGASFNISTSYENAEIAEQIRDDLEAIDIGVKIDTISFEQPSSFEILLAYWKVPLDPDQYYFWHSTQKQGNITNYKNVKVDKLLEDGRNSAAISDRKRIYDQFQRVIQDDTPAIFLYYPYVYTIKRI